MAISKLDVGIEDVSKQIKALVCSRISVTLFGLALNIGWGRSRRTTRTYYNTRRMQVNFRVLCRPSDGAWTTLNPRSKSECHVFFSLLMQRGAEYASGDCARRSVCLTRLYKPTSLVFSAYNKPTMHFAGRRGSLSLRSDSRHR